MKTRQSHLTILVINDAVSSFFFLKNLLLSFFMTHILPLIWIHGFEEWPLFWACDMLLLFLIAVAVIFSPCPLFVNCYQGTWLSFVVCVREDAARFVDFYVVSADNVVGWSGQKMPGLKFRPSPPLVRPKSKSAVNIMASCLTSWMGTMINNSYTHHEKVL